MPHKRICKPTTSPVEKLAGFADRAGLALWVVGPDGGEFLHVNDHAKLMYSFHDFDGSRFADWQRSGVAKGRVSNLIAYIDTEQYIYQVTSIFNRSPLIEFTAGHADTGAKCHVIHAHAPDGSWIQLRSMDGQIPAFDGMYLDEILGAQSLTPRSVERMIRRANHDGPLPIEHSLNLIAVPSAICSACGLVIYANNAMVRLLEQFDGLRLIAGRLIVDDIGVNDLMGCAIRDHADGGSAAASSLLQIPRRRGLSLIASIEPARWHLASVRGAEPMSLVSVVDPDQKPEIDPDCLRSLYGLSLAEAEVALLVGSGLSAKEVARVRGVSPGTVNNQLSAAYAKTGATSDAKLQQVISNLAKLRLASRPHPRAEYN